MQVGHLSRKVPTKYFVNSMSDLFHEEIPDSYLRKVLATIRRCPQHTFQILTKRAKRMAEFFQRQLPPRNAWLGVTVENRADGLPRIDYLRSIDTHVRFISAEPLREDLGEIDFSGIHWIIVGANRAPRRGR
jgi:protein gp37